MQFCFDSKKIITKTSVIFLLLIMQACGVDTSELAGRYQGYLTIRDNDETIITDVFIDATNKKFSGQAKVIDAKSEALIGTFTVKKVLSSKKIALKSSLFRTTSKINLVLEGTCAKSEESTDALIHACFSNGTINLSYQEQDGNYQFDLYASKDEGELPPDLSGEIELPEAIAFAKQYNLDALIKAQDVYKAREEMLLRRGNMFPNLNLGTILSAAEFPGGLLSEAGNLLPFLFPDNWFRLRESERLYDAEKSSYAALRANQVLIVQSLYYMILKDQSLVEIIESHLAKLNQLQDSVRAMVEEGEAPLSWEKMLRTKIIEDEEDLLTLNRHLKEQLNSLRNLLGGVPTREQLVISHVELPEIDQSIIRDLKQDESTAISKSPEIRQMIQLESAAWQLEKAVKWSWLNPNTDPRLNLGLGWIHAVNIEKANIKELQLKKISVERKIREQVINIENSLPYVARQSELLTEGMSTTRESYNIALQQFKLKELSIFELVEFIENVLKFEAKEAALNYSYLTLESNLDRLTLDTHFAEFASSN
ncbi:MAG: TolC family protein [Bdellovibrionota bacterium]